MLRLTISALLVVLTIGASAATGLGQPREGEPTTGSSREAELTAATTGARIFEPAIGDIIGPPDWSLILGPFGPAFSPPVSNAPINVTPTLTFREEFNDNVFLDNRRRRADFISALTPGARFLLQQPGYRVFAGYDVTAELYARNSELSNIGDRQNFLLDASYEWSPRLTLTLGDSFVRTYNTAQTNVQGISTGRAQTTTNTFAPGFTYELTTRDSLRVVGSYGVTRVDQAAQTATGSGSSTTYGLDATLSHVLTPRLNAILGYQGRRLEVATGDDTTVHTLRLGGSYQVTPLLTAFASAGASIQKDRAGTHVTPAVTASLTQQFAFGAATVSYNRSVSSSGTLGQATDTQSISAALLATRLWPGVTLAVAPRYSSSESSTLSAKVFAADLTAAYHVNRYVSAFASYTLLLQRSSGGAGNAAADIDQNRLFVGLQVRYPRDLP
jgi:hypothetical protein